ncbi:MAG: hypothetical protein IH845_05540 [Nanoarchaeota archaeon]|nr:hypothetical protein [Nanoarchaeota archaeon]
MINPFKRKITWMSLDTFNKVNSFSTFRVFPNKREIAVYSIMAINYPIPFSFAPVTNLAIKRFAIRWGWIR